MRAFLSAQRYLVLLTFLSIGILVVGLLLKPKKANTEAVVSESETTRLEQIAQKKNLQDMTAFLARVAGDTGTHIVYIPQAGATGIVWNNQGEVVTIGNVLPADGSAKVVLPGGTEAMAQSQPSDAAVVALQIAGGSALKSVSAVQPAVTVPASWVIQVARRPDASLFFTPGLSRGVRQVSCGDMTYHEIDASIELTPEMAGAGLFDLDGQLLGMVVPCAGREIVLPASDVEQVLNPPASPFAAIERQWGMKLALPDDAAKRYFRAEQGLLVREVRNDGLAARSGFVPGDVLLAFNGETVASMEDFLKLASGASVGSGKASVLRRGRKRMLSVSTPESLGDVSSGSAGDIGIQIEPPPSGYLVENVAAGSEAGRAGVLPGDRLLEVNGAKVRRFDDLSRLLKKPRDEPLYLVLSRGERRIGILLP